MKKDVKKFNLRVLELRTFTQRVLFSYLKFILKRLKEKSRLNFSMKTLDIKKYCLFVCCLLFCLD